MPIRCPQCGEKHDVIEFHAVPQFKCHCGFLIDVSLIETVDDFLRYFETEEEREKASEIQEDAQQICRMILDEQWPAPDIEIAKEELKRKVERLFPGKMQTYEMIYEARFKRLWQQFRTGDAEF